VVSWLCFMVVGCYECRELLLVVIMVGSYDSRELPW
jgi:hypothetical protein